MHGEILLHSFCSGNPPERHHSEDPGIEKWITLKQISKKLDGGQALD
jgi:hypothetical protein